MKFSTPLIKGTLIKRYKRFLADVALEAGGTVTAHCVNPGAMLGVKAPGLDVWLSPAPPGSTRKLAYTWQLVRVEKSLIGLNTSLPNSLVAEALEAGKIPELAGYTSIRREVKYEGNSRIDFLLEKEGWAPCYLEVKNVHLKRASYAEFPDSVTVRGAKHLRALSAVKNQGARAVVLYVVQREDCNGFKVAADIDPAYAALAKNNADIEFLCYACKVALSGIHIEEPLKVLA